MEKCVSEDYSNMHQKCDSAKTRDTTDPVDLKDWVLSAARSRLAVVGIIDGTVL